MKYFSNNYQYINAKCENCERILKIPRERCVVALGGLAISPPVLCKCGTTHEMIHGLPVNYDHQYIDEKNKDNLVTFSPEQILVKSLITDFAGSLHMRDWEDSTLAASLQWRKETVHQIVNIGEPAVDLLIELLGDSDWAVREDAALMLGHIKNLRAIEPLLATMQSDESLGVGLSAAVALERIGAQEALNTVHAWYQQKKISVRDRNNNKNTARTLYGLPEFNKKMMNAFDPHILAADLIEVRKIFADFFAARSEEDWERHTEKHNQGWTLRETAAHLDAVAQSYQRAIISTLAGKPCHFPGMSKRTDLPIWSRREIDARAQVSIAAICDSFLDTLQQASELAVELKPTDLTQSTPVPFYHRPITIGELLGGQAAHPGLVHAAQVANGAGIQPLWNEFSPELLCRQITRFCHVMSLAYWPERGGNLRAVVAMSAAGPGGGDWYVTMTPEGSQTGEGTYPRPTLKIWFRDADALCKALTLQVSPLRSVLTAQTFAWGDLRLAFQMGWLFNPA